MSRDGAASPRNSPSTATLSETIEACGTTETELADDVIGNSAIGLDGARKRDGHKPETRTCLTVELPERVPHRDSGWPASAGGDRDVSVRASRRVSSQVIIWFSSQNMDRHSAGWIPTIS